MRSLDTFLGACDAVAAVRRRLERIIPLLRPAQRVAPILLLGETGTGKGLLARAIHEDSPRAAGPFVAVNCAAIPEALLEGELFGFERGAFTNAHRTRVGLAQAASGGTLFLDEIALLPERLQGKLLTVLEDRAVRRLGATRTEAVDVLIIAASNADLEAAVRARQFRADLYHRLAGITITLPPLRERGADIISLAESFLARSTEAYRLPTKRFAADARRALLAHPWTGNVRELAHVMERVALLSEAGVITAEQLQLPGDLAVDPARRGRESEAPSLGTELRDLERARVLEALRQAGGNVARAARALGMPRTTLRYHVTKLRDGSARDPRHTPTARAASDNGRPWAGRTTVDRARWELRLVAMLRVDLPPPSTDTSPAVFGSAVEAVCRKVAAFGGRVEEIASTGIVAAFGLDPADDPATLAAHTALALQGTLERERGDGTTLALQATLHAGRVLVGSVHGVTRVDLHAKHAVLDVLESLTAAAVPGTAVVSEVTALLLRRRFHLEPIELGAAVGGRAYRLVGIERETRPAVAIPFVGREREVQRLRARLDRLDDHGRAAAVVGEAGLGKSRLLAELRDAIADRPVVWIEGRCAPYGRSVPYFAVRALLRELCAITGADDEAAVADRVGDVCRRLRLDAGTVEHLLPVVGPAAPIDEEVSALATRQGWTFEAVRQLLLAAARLTPLVVAVEDAQWIDQTSEQCLTRLAHGLGSAPLLLLVTHRPGYQPAWLKEGDGSDVVTLSPLGRRDSLSIVLAAVGAAPLPDALVADILVRAEGNPLFLEELARDARERGLVRVGVPATIQHVLQARIDRLAEDARQLLETASVLGPEFPRALLAEVAHAPDALDATLDTLARHEFLQGRGTGDDAMCVFRHLLVQETTYASLVPDRRMALHRAAAEALERLAGGRLPELYERLAHHWVRGGDMPSAARYLTLFAERAARGYARTEALAALEEALNLIEQLPTGPEQDRLLGELIRRQRGILHVLRDPRRPKLDFLLRQRPRVERLDDLPLRSLYFLWLGRLAVPLGEFALGIEAAGHAVAAAECSGDKIVVAAARSILSHAHFWLGTSREGLAVGHQALATLDGTGELYWLGYAWRAVSLNALQVTDFGGAVEAARRVGRIGDALDDDFFRFSGEWIAAVARLPSAGAEESLATARRVLERAPTAFEVAQASVVMGLTHLEHGRPAEAVSWLEPLVSQSDRLRQRHVLALVLAYLAEAYLETGALERAAALAADAARIGEEAGFAQAEGRGRRVLGRVAAARGMAVDGGADLDAAEHIYMSIGASVELARVTAARGELALAGGDPARARALLHEALGQLRKAGAVRYAEPIEGLLSRLD